MTRLVRDWKPEPVTGCVVAPHRYTWDDATQDDPSVHEYGVDALRRWQKTVPYQPGEVVYVERNGKAVLARILNVFHERNRFDERVAKFRVQYATGDGEWSKMWVYTYPGFIQRGYALAGLAPDVPKR